MKEEDGHKPRKVNSLKAEKNKEMDAPPEPEKGMHS